MTLKRLMLLCLMMSSASTGVAQVVPPNNPNLNCYVNTGVTACATDQVTGTESCDDFPPTTCSFGAKCHENNPVPPGNNRTYSCKGKIDGADSNNVEKQITQITGGGTSNTVPVFEFDIEDIENAFPLEVIDVIPCYSVQDCKCVYSTIADDYLCQRDGALAVCSILRLQPTNGPCATPDVNPPEIISP